MLKLLFSLEIVLLGVSSGIVILAPRYNTRIVSWYDTILMNCYTSTMLYLIIAEWVANSVYPDETPHFHLGLLCLLRPVRAR